jgi:hypothetical protein
MDVLPARASTPGFGAWCCAAALAWGGLLRRLAALLVAWARRLLQPGSAPGAGAHALREAGKRAFRERRHADAVAAFTRALAAGAALPAAERAVLLSNRSAAHAARGAFREAAADADAALSADASFHKAHLRRASALHGQAVTEGAGNAAAHLAAAAAALAAAADAARAAGATEEHAAYAQRSELAQLRVEAHALRAEVHDAARARAQRQLALADRVGDNLAAAEAAACLAVQVSSNSAPALERLAAVRAHADACAARLAAAARDAPWVSASAHARTLQAACQHWLGAALSMCRRHADAAHALSAAAALLEAPGVPAASAPLRMHLAGTLSQLAMDLFAARALPEAAAALARLDALDADAHPWRRNPGTVLQLAAMRSNLAMARGDVPAALAALRAALAATDAAAARGAQPPAQAALWAETQRVCLSGLSNLSETRPSAGAGAAEAAACRRRLFQEVLRKEPPDACAICLAAIAPLEVSAASEALTVLTGCCHVFHDRCAKRWLGASPSGGCPTCRGVVLHWRPADVVRAGGGSSGPRAPPGSD